jgi:hypothetical protein
MCVNAQCLKGIHKATRYPLSRIENNACVLWPMVLGPSTEKDRSARSHILSTIALFLALFLFPRSNSKGNRVGRQVSKLLAGDLRLILESGPFFMSGEDKP